MIFRLFYLRSVQLAVVLAGFIGLLAAVIPYGLSAGIEVFLRDRGARQATVGDVEFNLFTARFAVRGIHFDTGSAEPVDIAAIEGTLSHRALLRGRVLFDRLLVRNARLTGSRAAGGPRWRIGGIALADTPSSAPSPSVPGVVGVRVLQIANSAARLTLPGGTLDIEIASARLENLLPWVGNGQSAFDISGRIGGAEVVLAGTARPYAARPSLSATLTAAQLPVASLALMADAGNLAPQGVVSLGGKTTVEFDGDRLVLARYDGKIEGQGLSLQSPGLAERARAESVSWNGSLILAEGVEASGRLGARDIAATLAGGQKITAATMTLDGKTTVEFDGDRLVLARYDGPIEGRGLSLQLPGLAERARAEGVSWNGSLTLAEGVGASGRLGARDIAATLAGGQKIAAATMTLDDLRVAVAGDVSLRAFAVEGLDVESASVAAAAESRAPVFSARSLRGGEVALSGGDDLQVREVVAEGARLDFLQRGDRLTGPHRLFESGEKPADDTSRGFNVRITRAELAKGGVVSFRDETVTPAFAMDLRLEEAHAENIDSRRPDQPVTVAVKGKTGNYGVLEAHGQVRLFSAPLALKIAARAERLDLPRLTPYLARETGYAFKSGEGNLQANFTIDKGRLDAQTIITLRSVEVEPTRPDAASAAAANLAMPVEAALSMLRDKNNDIRLEIPVTGDLSAPRFDLSNVIAKAASGALKAASIGFLKYALQPFGAALMVGEFARKIAASIRLDPAVFRAGNGMVEPRHAAYLARVVAVMGERPGLRIKLCGRAVEGDRAALAERRKVAVTAITDADLTALAAARAHSLKGQLVRGNGLDPGRIIACQPEIDAATGAEPRAEILI